MVPVGVTVTALDKVAESVTEFPWTMLVAESVVVSVGVHPVTLIGLIKSKAAPFVVVPAHSALYEPQVAVLAVPVKSAG